MRSHPVTRAGITADRPGPECHKIAIGLTGDPVPRQPQRRDHAQE